MIFPGMHGMLSAHTDVLLDCYPGGLFDWMMRWMWVEIRTSVSTGEELEFNAYSVERGHPWISFPLRT